MVEVRQQTYDFIEMGSLKGHNDWVTCMVAGHSVKEGEDTPLLITGSRDKTLIIWKLYNENRNGFYGEPYKSLTGHNHFVSDLALANENHMVISSSWDKTLRLWDLKTGKTVRRFVGHTKEVYTVALSQDNRQIISAGADQGIKLWNTLGDCKFTTEDHNHNDWVSCIRYPPLLKTPNKGVESKNYFASVGWDGRLKIWHTTLKIRYSFKAHKGNINALSISRNFKYVATGGKDNRLNVYDVMDLKAPSRELEAGSTINQIAFNNKLQWIAAATDNDVKVWNLMSGDNTPITQLQYSTEKEVGKKTKAPKCISVCWNSLGEKLYAGYADGTIKVWHIEQHSEPRK